MDKKDKIDVDGLLGKIFNRPTDEQIEAARKRSWAKLEAEMAKREDMSVRSFHGDGWSVGPLQQLEYQVLRAIEAGNTPRTSGQILRAARVWAPGLMLAHVYTALTRLERRGFVTAHEVEDKDTRVFTVSGEGERALLRAKLEGKDLVTAEVEPLIEGLAEET